MGTNRLTGLALMLIHYDIPVDISEVIDEFSEDIPEDSRWLIY